MRGAAVFALALGSAPLTLAQAADISAARVWADATHTRVVLVASGPLEYTITRTAGSMLVDLGDSRLAVGFASPGAQGLYQGMLATRQGNRLQLTAKVAPTSRLKSFVLKPEAGGAYRLVIDLYPDKGVAAAAPSAAPRGAAGTAGSPAAVVAASAPAQDDRRPPVDSVSAAVTVDPAHPRSRMVASRQAATLLNGQRKVVIAIDAGHGGKDSGAQGAGGTQEKDITLAVARDLAAQINRQPGMKAVLTRNADEFVPLKRRYQIARDDSADLFVSIHADSFTSSDAKGSSVWVLSPRGKTNTAARWLADGQNRADLIGGVSLDDKDDGLAKVLLDLQQGYAMQASDAVAGNVLKALGALGPTHRGYVERANFVVLRSPDVPSILVETAFISNPREERKLRDPAHQRLLATAVMSGVKSYFESTPPPGTWFAAQAAARQGDTVASVRNASTGGVSADDANRVRARRKVVRATSLASRADANASDVHKVERGESLGSIAHQYGVSIGVLKSANRMNDDVVRAGTVLTIPGV
ncbi:MAG TPA: N-acetylmuramoyl-L-alanine amidase [Rhodanobacter sp.]|nr:N-acetylmuramoyl-L-alanine amidase [Rhodanobacter sp.]